MDNITRFRARYDGECSDCGDYFEEGDFVGYVDDELCCGECVQSAEDEQDESGWFK